MLAILIAFPHLTFVIRKSKTIIGVEKVADELISIVLQSTAGDLESLEVISVFSDAERADSYRRVACRQPPDHDANGCLLLQKRFEDWGVGLVHGASKLAKPSAL